MNIVQKLIGKIRDIHDTSKRRAELRKMAVDIAKDGVVTDDELASLEKQCATLGLPLAEVQQLKMIVLNTAMTAAKSDRRLSADEEASLQRVITYFGLPITAIQHSKQELARFKLMEEIERGVLPTLDNPGIILQKNEIAHWGEPVNLLEEKVISRQYVGGSSGVSVRICKGVSYRVGAQRGQLVTQTGILPVSSGPLVVTNKRVVFSGDRKSLASKLENLIDINVFSDGMQLSFSNKSKPYRFQFVNKAHVEIMSLVLSGVINA